MLRSARTVFEAIAHPVRRDLLDALRRAPGPLSITELGELCDVSRSTASRHLDILRATGVVIAQRSEPSTFHALDRAALEPIDDWLGQFVDPGADGIGGPNQQSELTRGDGDGAEERTAS